MQEDKQNRIINAFANGLRRIGQGQFAQLVKLNKPLILDGLAKAEDEKEDAIIEDAKKNASRIVNEALLRAEKIEIRTETLERNMKIFKKH